MTEATTLLKKSRRSIHMVSEPKSIRAGDSLYDACTILVAGQKRITSNGRVKI